MVERHGVLVQSAVGNGEIREICCIYDENYREYIKSQQAYKKRFDDFFGNK